MVPVIRQIKILLTLLVSVVLVRTVQRVTSEEIRRVKVQHRARIRRDKGSSLSAAWQRAGPILPFKAAAGFMTNAHAIGHHPSLQ